MLIRHFVVCLLVSLTAIAACDEGVMPSTSDTDSSDATGADTSVDGLVETSSRGLPPGLSPRTGIRRAAIAGPSQLTATRNSRSVVQRTDAARAVLNPRSRFQAGAAALASRGLPPSPLVRTLISAAHAKVVVPAPVQVAPASLAKRSTVSDDDETKKDINAYRLKDEGWIGLMAYGRPVVTAGGTPQWLDHTKARWVRRGWSAEAPVTEEAANGPLSGWIGSGVVGIDDNGRTCEGMITGLAGRARVIMSETPYPGMENQRPKTAAAMLGSSFDVAILASVRWERRSCARRSIVVRRRGASLPVVYKRTTADEQDTLAVARAFRWSKAWKEEQLQYETEVGDPQKTEALAYDRFWDATGPTVTKFTAPDGTTKFIAQAMAGGECGEPGGALSLRFDWRSEDPKAPFDPDTARPIVADEISPGAAPQLLLHFPMLRDGSQQWLGVDKGLRLNDRDGVAVEPPFTDLYVPDSCGC